MNTDKPFHVMVKENFDNQYSYLTRHFKGIKGWIVKSLLGQKRIYNMLYDSFDCGAGGGYYYAASVRHKEVCELTKKLENNKPGLTFTGILRNPSCRDSCGGCSCHLNPPCSHCTDHIVNCEEISQQEFIDYIEDGWRFEPEK